MQPNGHPVTMFTGVMAPNKMTLVASLPRSGFTFGFGGMPKPPDLFIAMPCCGEVRCWQDISWVPDHDVGPCSCGNWFIRYTGEKPQ